MTFDPKTEARKWTRRDMEMCKGGKGACATCDDVDSLTALLERAQAAEREACEKLVRGVFTVGEPEYEACQHAADAIRARGDK